ncbi:MAG: endonuclease III domain-containing protein [Terracidiphilus sp.]
MTAVTVTKPSIAESLSLRGLRQLTPAERLRRIYDRLAKAYGPQHWWPAETPLEVILGAYLTQNTAWKAVERSLANLRKAGALTLDGLRSRDLKELQNLIRPSGFITRKAPALKAFVAMLDEEFAGSLDLLSASPTVTLRRRLLALPGVGPETADAILLYALNHPVPVADEYLRRIAGRHRLVMPPPGPKDYNSLVNLTRQAFSSDPLASRVRHFNEFHALTVAVGKAHCGRTAHCTGCPLSADLQRIRYPEKRKATPLQPSGLIGMVGTVLPPAGAP